MPRNLDYQRPETTHTHTPRGQRTRGMGEALPHQLNGRKRRASPVREYSIMTSIPFRIQKANHSPRRKRESEISRIIAASQGCQGTAKLSHTVAAYSHIIVRFLFAPLRQSCCYCNNLGIIFISPARTFI